MRLFAALGGVIALVAAGVWLITGQSYRVDVALPSATNIIEGGVVTIHGFPVGEVKKIRAEAGAAVLTLGIDRDRSPLHEGAVVSVPFKALLGERFIDIKDGPATNATIPDGGRIQGAMPSPIEVDQVLNALGIQESDKPGSPNEPSPTLERIKAVVNEIDATVRGHEGNINASVSAAGPALNALGNVLNAVGTDGPAIRNLVTRLNGMVGTLSDRQQDIRAIVTEFSRLTALAAKHQAELREGLRQLPPTLQTARGTLSKLPATADKTVPLLDELGHPTDKLVSVASNLRPMFEDLRPTLHDLGPTLSSLDKVLDNTPGLLDSAHDALPDGQGLTETVNYLDKPLNFLRPYTPEAIGWLSNWNSAFASYDSNGHYFRVYVQGGPTTLIPNPGALPPGVSLSPYVPPGSNGGTPWTDAYGSGMK